MTTQMFEAAYIPTTDVTHTGNPLIDALPRIRADDEWIEQLLKVPSFEIEQREFDAHMRSYLVSELKHLFLPTAQHVKVARRVDQLIRDGYKSRHPLSPERVKLLHKTYAKAQSAGKSTKLSFVEVQPIRTFSLIGCSGVGKSTAMEHVLASYPQCIYHPEHHITQLVWLKVECPKAGGVKDLALSILRKFDRILGTTYTPKTSRANADELTALVSHLAVAHHLGILVLDEMQNLSAKKSGGREEMLNWFQELVNELKLPIVLLGTHKAKRVIELDLRHARRVTVVGSEVWDPMRDDEEFGFLLEKMWDYCWLRDAGELTSEMRKTVYEETQGIRAFMADMFLVTQLHALWKGVEAITPDLFRSVARKEFSAVQPMLNAFRSKDPNRLRKFDDIHSYDLDDHIERVRGLIPASDAKVAMPSEQTTMFAKACANVQSCLGISAEEAKDLVRRCLQDSHKTAAALTKAAIAAYSASNSEAAVGDAA